MEITGTVVYQELEGGFWGIIDAQHKKWRLVNAPAALCKAGQQVKIKAEKVEEAFSIFMWGKPVQVLSFEVLAS